MLAEAPGGVKRKGGDAPPTRAAPARVPATGSVTRGVDLAAGRRSAGCVSDPPPKPPREPAPRSKPATGPDREARLAAALRDNLRRRKAGGGKGPE